MEIFFVIIIYSTNKSLEYEQSKRKLVITKRVEEHRQKKKKRILKQYKMKETNQLNGRRAKQTSQ